MPIAIADLADGESLWLHDDSSFADAETWLAAHGIDENLLDSLTRPDSRPRTLTEEAGTLLIMRGVNTNPGAVPEDMVSIRVWLEPRRIENNGSFPVLPAVWTRSA